MHATRSLESKPIGGGPTLISIFMLKPLCSDRVVLREALNTKNISMQHHLGAQHHHAAQQQQDAQHHHAAQHQQGAQGQQESQY